MQFQCVLMKVHQNLVCLIFIFDMLVQLPTVLEKFSIKNKKYRSFESQLGILLYQGNLRKI